MRVCIHQYKEGGHAERGGCAGVGHGASVAENVSRSSSCDECSSVVRGREVVDIVVREVWRRKDVPVVAPYIPSSSIYLWHAEKAITS